MPTTGIVFLRWQDDPVYLVNQKLQAKLILVALLTANAFVLHRLVFTIICRAEPVPCWSGRNRLLVSASVSFSNSLWLFCAFLGVASIWDSTVGLAFVLTVALACWVALLAVVNAILALASRDRPKPQPDWIDPMKTSLSDFADLRNP
jgi:hypothetical protein